jgi:hypothetical protein
MHNDIYMQEVRTVMHKMKNDKKSTGPTGFTAEMLKASGES